LLTKIGFEPPDLCKHRQQRAHLATHPSLALRHPLNAAKDGSELAVVTCGDHATG